MAEPDNCISITRPDKSKATIRVVQEKNREAEEFAGVTVTFAFEGDQETGPITIAYDGAAASPPHPEEMDNAGRVAAFLVSQPSHKASRAAICEGTGLADSSVGYALKTLEQRTHAAPCPGERGVWRLAALAVPNTNPPSPYRSGLVGVEHTNQPPPRHQAPTPNEHQIDPVVVGRARAGNADDLIDPEEIADILRHCATEPGAA